MYGRRVHNTHSALMLLNAGRIADLQNADVGDVREARSRHRVTLDELWRARVFMDIWMAHGRFSTARHPQDSREQCDLCRPGLKSYGGGCPIRRYECLQPRHEAEVDDTWLDSSESVCLPRWPWCDRVDTRAYLTN